MRLPSGRIYLDHNATTPLDPRVREAQHAAQAVFGNASSVHREGRDARDLLEEARGKVASFVGCLSREVVFTGSGTEANHLALLSAATGCEGRRRLLISAAEHPSVLEQRGDLEARGVRVEVVPLLPSGQLDPEALEKALDSDVSALSLVAAHNETGVLMDLEAAAAHCARHGVLLHTDAVQAAGKIPLPWCERFPDYLSLAGHKLYGPKGVGVLVVRDGAPVKPLLRGGGQEGGRRASTEAVPLAASFGVACELCGGAQAWAGKARAMRDSLEAALKRDFGAIVHSEAAPRLPNTSFFSLAAEPAGAEVVRRLDDLGFAVSAGSACHSDGASCPRILSAMGVHPRVGGRAVRVSLGRATEEEDLAAFLRALPGALDSAGA
jgi:cysteine desulfurase